MPQSTNTELPTLRFASKHIEAIKNGEKTATFRVGLDPAIAAGRQVELLDDTGSRLGTTRVTECAWTTVANAAAMDIDGHRSYNDVDELLAELQAYYPGEDLHEQSRVDIVCWAEVRR